jgi:hypothetical protein
MQKASWIGYWQQPPFGRQPMNDLQLEIGNGKIKGSGWDIIGLFTFDGDYHNDGTFTLVKHYLGQHYVLYRGMYDGEGTISGEWTIREGERVTLGAGYIVWSDITLETLRKADICGPFQMRVSRSGSPNAEIQTLD